jgi:hypothetical protein
MTGRASAQLAPVSTTVTGPAAPWVILTLATARPIYQARWHFGRPVCPQPALVSQ